MHIGERYHTLNITFHSGPHTDFYSDLSFVFQPLSTLADF